MSDVIKFDVVEELIVSQNIDEPDKHLDDLIAATKPDSPARLRLETIKSLDHATKVKWLLNLKDDSVPSRNQVVCTIVVVTVVFTVIIGYKIVNGAKKAITEQRKRQEQQRKCVEEGSQ